MSGPWDDYKPKAEFNLRGALAETDEQLGLPKGYSAAQIKVESAFKPDAKSPAGAMGLAQVMPATLKTLSQRVGRQLDPYDPQDSVLIHREVMRENLAKFKNPDDAARAYNGGWSPERWSNPETAAYAGKIRAAMGTQPNPVMAAVGSAVNAVVPSAQAATPQASGNPWDDYKPAQAPQRPATDRDRLLSSMPMRVAKGAKDPIDGAAQLLTGLLPDFVVNGVNKAADFVGGEGTFLGDVLGIKGTTTQQLTKDIKTSDTEYEDARKATGQTGFDGARLAGNVLSPVNAVVARAAPALKAVDTVFKLAAKGAITGAAGAATQPVLTGELVEEKAKQLALGAAAGGVLTPLVSKAAQSVARFIQNRTQAGTVTKSADDIAFEIKTSLARDDIDIGQIPKAVLDKLTLDAQQALKTGRQINSPAALRAADFEQVGVKPLLGQVTRDPNQFTKELNLRGVQGVGEPITNRLNEQQNAIAQRFRQSTAGAQNPYEAGRGLIERLQGADNAMTADIRASYKAFKDSTGKELEVPLQGLSQDYAKTLRDFGQTIPGAVRSQFEELGLLSGKQLKLLSIDDAENLIKTINKNFNPADKAQATALNELRGHVQKAVLEVTDSGAGMEAATLASMARDTARNRFKAIDDIPAFKAVINGAEPDDFVKKYVINGKVAELNKLSELVGPDGQTAMRQQMLKYLEGKAFGANAAGDGAGRQASFNAELSNIGRNKLEALLGKQQADDLFTVGRVMAYIQQQPAGSAVNNSNTGAAIANLLSKISGSVKGAPYINDFIVKPMQSFRERGEVNQALSAAMPKQATELNPETINRLAQILGPVPVGAGAALGYSVR